MEYSVFSIIMVLLLTKIQDVTPDDLRFQEKMTEASRVDVTDTAEFRTLSSKLKHADKHFLFQIHDAIKSLHAHYLTMLRNETLMLEQYGMKPNISHQCVKALREFSLGLKEKRLWALMMVDSRGNIPSGILDGTFYSTGDFDQCIDSKAPGKFQGQYCEVGVIQNIPFQYKSSDPLEPVDLTYVHETDQTKVWDFDDKFPNGLSPVTTSICTPSTCSIEDIKFLISKVSNAFEGILKIGVSKCIVNSQRQYKNSEKFWMTLIIMIVVLEIIATVMDIRSNAFEEKNTVEKSLLKKTLLCLSLRTNFKQFFKQRSNPDFVKIFNGLRVIFTFLIIHVHHLVYTFLQENVQVRPFFKYLTTFPAIYMWNTISTDTFFFMSGFLVLYGYIKSGKPSLNIVNAVFKRYLRLWIPVLFSYESSLFFLNMSQGPMWSSKVELMYRSGNNWLKNVLCINNIFTESQFLGWTWYLAADIQLYTAACFILLIYRKNPEKAMLIVKIITVADLVLLSFIQYYNAYPIMISAFTKLSSYDYVAHKIFIYPTYCHIATFCVGMLTCHVTSTMEDVQLSKGLKIFGWILCITLTCTCWFLPHIWNGHRAATTIESVLFGGFYRLLWSLPLAWITFLSFKKERGILLSLLSWDGFTYLGNITFMMYLIHFYVILIKGGMARNRYPYSFSTHIASSLVIIAVTSPLAFILHLVCEAPLNGLINLLSSYSKGRKEVKKIQ